MDITLSYKKQQPACDEFFSQSIEHQEKVFSTLPLERQLEIYRCGMKKKPPIIALAYDIAKGGEKILPQLSNTLRDEKDEWMQNALIDIFRIMSQDGHLKGKNEVLQQIRNTVSNMKITRIREEAEQSLREIEGNVAKT